MEAALVEEGLVGGSVISGLPELTAASCVPSPPQNILTAAFCLLGFPFFLFPLVMYQIRLFFFF